MAHLTIRVRNGLLEAPGRDGLPTDIIPVGSSEWFDWLAQHRSFRFEHSSTPYTARREQRPGGWYWYASRRFEGILHTLYLGRSEDLTLERLDEVAQRLARVPLHPSRADVKATRNVSLSPDLLLATKLTAPQARPTHVARPRLITRLQTGIWRKLVLVVAPAGYGKTTLLSAWIASSTLPAAWISLDSGDNDPMRFWSYVITALDRQHPGIGERLLPVIRAAHQPPAEVLLILLINALAATPEGVVLVFDDYHLIHTASIHAALTFLLEHLPPHVHLVLISRAEPPFSLARLRARGDVTELNLADLRFTPDEVATFLYKGAGLDLSASQVDKLATRTEGWITGLQLAALSLQQYRDAARFIETFSGDDRHIFDYFTEEVLQGQPEHLQAFLLKTSILESMSGPLCDAIIDQQGSAEILRALEQANLFVAPTDTQRNWYRYHPLFAELLRRRLDQVFPGLEKTLYLRATAWYARHGLLHQAIHHALDAEDFVWAARLVEEVVTTTLRFGEAVTRLAWLEELPGEIIATRPRLELTRTQAYLELGQFAAAASSLQDAEAALIACSDLPANEQRILSAWVRGLRSTIAINFGDAQGAIEDAQYALAIFSSDQEQYRIEIAQLLLNLADAHEYDNDPAMVESMYSEAVAHNRAAGNLATAITTMSGLGRTQARQGNLHEAAQTLREALALAREGDIPLPWPSTGKAHVYLGALLYEWNDLDGAAHHLTEGIHLCQQWGHVYHQAEGFMFMAMVQTARGNQQTACAMLEQAQLLVDEATLGARKPVFIPRLRQLSNELAATQAEFLLARDDLDEATQQVQQCGLNLTITLDRSPTEYDLTLARLLVALGRTQDAVSLTERLASTLESEQWTDYTIKVLTAHASTLEARGETMRALPLLERALQLARSGGFVRTFLDEGTRVHRLLSLLAANNRPTTDYARALLTTLHAGHEHSRLPESDLAESLSEREIAILRLLATGLSSPEVATHLIIAVSTVRTHIKHIYAKLQVHTRAEAVRQAQMLRLL